MILPCCDILISLPKVKQRIPPGFCLLGDSGFPLLGWLVTPFRDHGNLTRQQKLFNKTHSRCREVIERAFGMLKNRFRRLYMFEMLDLTLSVNNVLAACVLHNICISEDDGDLQIEPQQPNAAENFDDVFARDRHKLQGVQLRQQLMQHLINEFKEHSSIFFLYFFFVYKKNLN